MNYMVFYFTLLLIWVVFLFLARRKPIRKEYIAVAIISMVYSLAFDIVFGEQLHLYYYISQVRSSMYILISGILLYPILHIIFLMYLPSPNRIVIYTAVWVVAMIALEVVALKAETIVFTGWKVFPWSFFIDILTYFWIITLYRYFCTKKVFL